MRGMQQVAHPDISAATVTHMTNNAALFSNRPVRYNLQLALRTYAATAWHVYSI